MKEKMHITILTLGVCALMGMTFAVSSKDYKEKVPKLDSAPEASINSQKFECTKEAVSENSPATKEYKKNLDKWHLLYKKTATLNGGTITNIDPCDGLKGKKRTECNINNIELRGILKQIKRLEEKMMPYEECLKSLGITGDTDKEISGEVNTGKKTKKKEGTTTTNLPGDNNDIVWTAKDPNVRIKYLSPAGITTTVAVVGENVIVTPGIKTNMLVSNSLTPKSPTNPARLLMYAGKDLGGHIWTHNGIMMSFSGLKAGEASMSYNGQNWTYASHSGTGNFADYVAQKIANTITPDGLTDWIVYVGSGQPIVTALASNASQVIAAVAADPVASTLLAGTLAPGNDGTGAISAMDMLTFCTSDSESSTCTDSYEGKKTKKKEGTTTTKEKKIQPISKWFEGEWSICSNSKQERTVECQSDGKKVADNKCAGKKPNTSKACKNVDSSTSKSKDESIAQKGITQVQGKYTALEAVNILEKAELISPNSINRIGDTILFQDHLDLILRVMNLVPDDRISDYNCKHIFTDVSEPRICRIAEIALENGIIKKQGNESGDILFRGTINQSLYQVLHYNMLSQCIKVNTFAYSYTSMLEMAKNLGITNTSTLNLGSAATKGDVYISLVEFMNSTNLNTNDKINSSYFDTSIAGCTNRLSGS